MVKTLMDHLKDSIVPPPKIRQFYSQSDAKVFAQLALYFKGADYRLGEINIVMGFLYRVVRRWLILLFKRIQLGVIQFTREDVLS
jgi:hypothetical protein